MTFKFNTQNKFGEIGEKNFLRKHPNFKKFGIKDSYEVVDFKNIITGKTVELKTDSYSVFDTQNMFIETISNDRKGTIGGPFRGEKTIDFYVYYFLKNDIAFWYKTDELCNLIRKKYNLKNTTKIPNEHYNTLGIKVSRLTIKDCCFKIEKFNNRFSKFVNKNTYFETYQSII